MVPVVEQGAVPRGLPESWEPRCAALAIGSLPHSDPDLALELVLGELPEIACWPQLPAAGPQENMYAQFSEGLPGLVVERDGVRCERSRPEFQAQFEALFDSYIRWAEGSGPLPGIAPVSMDYARGLYRLLSVPPAALVGRVAVKGQVTGPLSLGLAVTDESRRPLLYDDGLREAICLLLRIKAAWQEQALAALGLPVVMFLDEPYMSTYGSAYFNYDASLVRAMIASVTAGLKATIGVHCCANTDWSLILGGPARIVSFDAYGYAETLALYPDEVAAHLDGGGMLAFGIVPALAGDLDAAALPDLLKRFRYAVSLLAQKGIQVETILRRSLITPSCGLRGLTEEKAARALRLCRAISESLREGEV